MINFDEFKLINSKYLTDRYFLYNVEIKYVLELVANFKMWNLHVKDSKNFKKKIDKNIIANSLVDPIIEDRSTLKSCSVKLYTELFLRSWLNSIDIRGIIIKTEKVSSTMLNKNKNKMIKKYIFSFLVKIIENFWINFETIFNFNIYLAKF